MRRQLARIAISLSVAFAAPAVPAAGQATTYGYDANGNVVSKLEDGVAWSYIYDTRNLLVEVQRDGLLVETYQYDYRGLRIRKAGPGGVIRYVWDGDRILLETDDFGNTIAKYEYADDRLLAIRHESEGTAFYLFDALGSPVALSELDGSLAARYSYDAWGAIRRTVGASSNEFMFTAYQFDEATGLHYAKARFYDSEIGRFLSQDPLPGGPFEPLSLHPYLYARANPTTYVDPDGRCATKGARQSEFCQAIARGIEFVIAGDPEAEADREIAIREKVVEGRRRFRAETGRDPQPDEVVWSDGQQGLTSDFRQVDMTGRIEPARTEWMIVGAGIGTRLAVSSARAAGATASEQIATALTQLADEAVGEITGVSPSDVADLAHLANRGWNGASSPPQPSRPGSVVIGESSTGPGVTFGSADGDSMVVADRSVPSVAEDPIMSAYPRDRRVAGGREGRRSSDPSPGLQESGAFRWTPENISRMERGQPPIGVDGRPIELHHRDQDPTGPLDELQSSTHQTIDHPERPSRIDRDRFAGERRRYWVERVRQAHGQGQPSDAPAPGEGGQ